jgi:hypothetical protein
MQTSTAATKKTYQRCSIHFIVYRIARTFDKRISAGPAGIFPPPGFLCPLDILHQNFQQTAGMMSSQASLRRF